MWMEKDEYVGRNEWMIEWMRFWNNNDRDPKKGGAERYGQASFDLTYLKKIAKF